MRLASVIAIVVALGVGVCSGVYADPYGAQVQGTLINAVTNTWAYTVRNTSTDPSNALWIFSVKVDALCDVSSTVTPLHWSVDTSTPHTITWVYQTSMLPAGEAFSGFQATYWRSPQSQSNTALFYNTVNGTYPYTEGVVYIPEPGSIAALITGLFGFAGLALRRRQA